MPWGFFTDLPPLLSCLPAQAVTGDSAKDACDHDENQRCRLPPRTYEEEPQTQLKHLWLLGSSRVFFAEHWRDCRITRNHRLKGRRGHFKLGSPG